MAMRALCGAMLLLLAVAWAPSVVAAPSDMRPYSGIGILSLAGAAGSDNDHGGAIYLYREPAISRLGELRTATVPRYEQLFGRNPSAPLLIVTVRKGDWLRVVFDDAGREAWMAPRRRDLFQPWDAFLKGRTCRLLAAIPKQYYQLYKQPGRGATGTMTPKQPFRVVKVRRDWALVMPDQNTLGWLRWRDDDGRLLISVEIPREP